MYFQNVLIALILNSWKYIFNLHIIYNYNLDLTKTIFSMLNWSLTVIQSIAHTLNEVTLMVYYMKSFVTSIPMLFCWRKNCFYRHIFPQCFITTKWLSFLSLLIFSYARYPWHYCAIVCNALTLFAFLKGSYLKKEVRRDRTNSFLGSSMYEVGINNCFLQPNLTYRCGGN